jgi:hypothetical protein
MNCDSYFELGTNHEHCQDYVIHGCVNNYCFLIGSDGCSSSAQSDVGARLLCHTAKAKLTEMIKDGDFEKQQPFVDLQFKLQAKVLKDIDLLKLMLALEITNFDATLNILITNGEHL